jgi:hypothetical protein
MPRNSTRDRRARLIVTATAGIATVGNLTFVGEPERETRRRALAGAGAIMIITSWAQLAAHLLDGATADPPPQDQLQRST